MIFQKYPVLRYLILLVLGIVLHSYCSIYFLFSGLLISLFLGGLAVYNYRFNKFRHSVAVSFFFLGACVAWTHNELNTKNHFSHFKNPEAIQIKVNSYTDATEKTYKVKAKVIGVFVDKEWKTSSGTLLMYFSNSIDSLPVFGEIYITKANFQEVKPPLTSYDFDYKKYLANQNIYFQQFVKSGEFKKIGEEKSGLFYWANRANVYTHEVFAKVLTDKNELGVAEAMIAGMRSELSEETLDWYTKTGTVHALAVSGMHVAILFWVLNAFFSLFLNKRKLPFIATVLVLLWVYALFTGLSASVCRSTLMFSLFQVGMYLRRNGNSVNTLLASALILLLFVPTWIYDVGFQLSYLAVLGILIFYPKIKQLFQFKFKGFQWLWDITAVSIAAQVYTLPLVLYYFQQFPNYSLLANPAVSLLCIPMLPLGLMLLLFSWVPVLNSLIAWLFKVSIILMNASVYWVYKLPNAVLEGVSLSVFGVVILFVIIAFYQAYLNHKNSKYLGLTVASLVVLLISGGAKRINQATQNELIFHYIPKGSGVSLLSGRTAYFLASDSVINTPKIYKYYLRNLYNTKGVNVFNPKSISLKENQLVCLEGVEFFWLQNKSTNVNFETPYVLVSNQALDFNAENNKTTFVFDGTNSSRYIEKMKEKYKDAVYLSETGIKIIKLPYNE